MTEHSTPETSAICGDRLIRIRQEVLEDLGRLSGNDRSEGIALARLIHRCPSKPTEIELKGVLLGMTKRAEVLRVNSIPPKYRLPIRAYKRPEPSDLESPDEEKQRAKPPAKPLKPNPVKRTQKQKIMDLLDQHGTRTGKQIYAEIGPSCYTAISELSKAGKIESTGFKGNSKVWALSNGDAETEPEPDSAEPEEIEPAPEQEPEEQSEPEPAQTLPDPADTPEPMDVIAVDPAGSIPTESEFNLAVTKLRVQQLLASIQRHAEARELVPPELPRELRRRIGS